LSTARVAKVAFVRVMTGTTTVAIVWRKLAFGQASLVPRN
jgi:hypothetical protein